MNNFDEETRRKLYEEKMKLENKAQDPEYQKEEFKDEKEFQSEKWCRILLIALILLTLIYDYVYYYNIFFGRVINVIQIISFIYIINCRIKYPHNDSIAISFRIMAVLAALVILYLICMIAFCWGTISCLEASCSGMPG